jgi:hypothetical protein
MDNRFWFRLKVGSCGRRNLFFALWSTRFFRVLQRELRRQTKEPTPST